MLVNGDRASHAHCVPRQDHDRLMGMMNMARGANSNLAGETRQLQMENKALHALLADACHELYQISQMEGPRSAKEIERISDYVGKCLERIKEGHAPR